MSSETTTGLAKVEVVRIGDNQPGVADVEYVPAEREFRIVVNDQVETALYCAPHRVRSLVLGWMVGEGVIDDESQFNAIDTDLDTWTLRLKISPEAGEKLAARALTGPVGKLAEPEFPRRVDTALELTPEQVADLAAQFKRLFLGLKSADRMCYLAAFARGGEILSYGEGFHRLNAMYRALGELVSSRVAVEGRIAMANFGLTRELTARLARAGVNMAITAAPPSSAAIEFANRYYLCIVSTAIGGRITVYSAPWRVL